jgi:signal transduction histidine kinase
VAEHPRSRLVLDWLHGLLTAAPPAAPTGTLLTALAQAFGTTAAGLTPPTDSSADGTPWVEPSLLTAQLRTGGAQEAIGPSGASFLLSPLPGSERAPRILWLEEPPGRVWNDDEKGALVLAGLVLGRLLPALATGPERLAPLDQERLQERLHDAAIMAGRVAHAFDNVLTGILGFAELMLGQSSDPTLEQYVGEVLQAAQIGVQLTQQLHLFHRCGTAGGGPTRLATVLADAEHRLRSTLASGIDLVVTVPNDLPAVAVDDEPLRHVLDHLLENARESLNGPGSIHLTAQRSELDAATCATLYGRPQPGPCVEVTIADTGCGLSAEARQRLIREPFFTTKPRHRGLGLAVVHRILSAHHGGFQLEAGPRGGTIARVYLPLANATTPLPGQRPWSAHAPGTSARRDRL